MTRRRHPKVKYGFEVMEIPVGLVRSDIVDQIAGSLPVRREAVRYKGHYAPADDHPITDAELRSFLSQFVPDDPFMEDALLTKNDSYVISVRPDYYDRFLRAMATASLDMRWLAAEDPYYIKIPNDQPQVEARTVQQIASDRSAERQVDPQIRLYAPSLNVLFALTNRKVDLDRLNWRQLEEMIAELLKVEGYEVELNRGTKDGGADVIAYRNLPAIGAIKTVWQSKHLKSGGKVGLSMVRELADVRGELAANKGMIVTSSYLTKGALRRIQRDQYSLGKLERPELQEWIHRALFGTTGESMIS